VIAIAAVLSLSSCVWGGPQRSSTADSTVAPIGSPVDDIAAAVRFRRAYGLVATDQRAREVAGDPAAVRDYGVALTPEEVEIVHRRLSLAKATLVTAEQYARRYPEFAGGFIDVDGGGIPVVSFTSNVEAHRQAITGLVGSDTDIEVRSAAATESELRALKDRVIHDPTAQAWLESIGAELISVGIKPSLNMVRVRISSGNPDAPMAIIERYEARGMMYVESDGLGVRLMPTGTLVVRAIDQEGAPASDITVACTGDLPETGSGDLGSVTDADGVWASDLTATSYECVLLHGDAAVGWGRALVSPRQVTEVVIHVRS
jgi:hypothetical protein